MNQLKKVLRHLTNTPVAVALAFLLVGAPSAPVGEMMPSSGDASAHCYIPLYGVGGWMPMTTGSTSAGGGGHYLSAPDADCDGIPDEADRCPHDAANDCGGGWGFYLTGRSCVQDIKFVSVHFCDTHDRYNPDANSLFCFEISLLGVNTQFGKDCPASFD